MGNCGNISGSVLQTSDAEGKRVEKGHLMRDHCAYDDLDPPKSAVSQLIGYDKSATT